MPISTNRTKWPTTGGALAFQPGWATGHKTAFIYVNIGLGTVPQNYSHVMQPVFQIIGPSNQEYVNGSVCLPQVGLPANISIRAGDNATIQVVEAALHGAGLYNVSCFIGFFSCFLLPLLLLLLLSLSPLLLPSSATGGKAHRNKTETLQNYPQS